jgi:hypothetical protein
MITPIAIIFVLWENNLTMIKLKFLLLCFFLIPFLQNCRYYFIRDTTPYELNKELVIKMLGGSEHPSRSNNLMWTIG